MSAPRFSRRRFLRLAAAAGAVASSQSSLTPARAATRTHEAKHFVLIHGAWHGAWCWYKLVPALEAAGHRVTAFDLPSAGIDGTPAASVTLQAQAERVIAVLDGVAEPVILVGHSAGGAVVSTVAEARPERIEKLVYLSAFLLRAGASIASAGLQDTGSRLSAHLMVTAAGTLDVDPAARRDIFYGDCDDRDVALAQALLKPIGLHVLGDPVAVGDTFERVRRFYVSCLRDHALSPAAQRAMYTALPCEKVLVLRSDHSPFLSHPGALLRALSTIARV